MPIVCSRNNQNPRLMKLIFEICASKLLQSVTLSISRFSLVASRPIEFLDKSWSVSNSPHPTSYQGPLLRKLNFHWFLVDQWGFEQNRAQILIHEARLPMTTHFPTENRPSRAFWKMLLSDWLDRQADKHFLFARPFLSEKGMTNQSSENSNSTGSWPANRIETKSNSRFELST